MTTPPPEEHIANLLRSIETLQNEKAVAERSLEILRNESTNLARINQGLQQECGVMREALLHVLKACNEHPTEAGRLLSESFVEKLKGLRRLLAA